MNAKLLFNKRKIINQTIFFSQIALLFCVSILLITLFLKDTLNLPFAFPREDIFGTVIFNLAKFWSFVWIGLVLSTILIVLYFRKSILKKPLLFAQISLIILSVVATSYIFLKPNNSLKIPVLAYHRVVNYEDGMEKWMRPLMVAPNIFDKQLDYIEDQGFTTITTKDLHDFKNGKKLPKKPIILTFDDGYLDNYITAFPKLKERGMKGEFAIITGQVGKPDFMNWDQLNEMKKDGMYFSSHTVSHCMLAKKESDGFKVRKTDPKRNGGKQKGAPDSKLCKEQEQNSVIENENVLKNELVKSKEDLEINLNLPIYSIIYPIGVYTEHVIEESKNAGYEFGFTTEMQNNEILDMDKPFEIKRYNVFRASKDDEIPTGFFAGYR